MKQKLIIAAGLAAFAFTATASAAEVMACISKKREAADTVDPLECRSAAGASTPTLHKLYEDGWHIGQIGYFGGDRTVFYMERATAAPAAPAPTPTP